MAPPQVKASRAVLADRTTISFRKRRRDALEAASVAAAVAAAAAAPLHPPSTSGTSTGSSSTPIVTNLLTPPPTTTGQPCTTATTTNTKHGPASTAAGPPPPKQLEQLQQLKPLLAALMAEQDPMQAMPLPMPPPNPPPPPPPPWRQANGVHACPALRLALRLGRVPDAGSPTTTTTTPTTPSCALCGEMVPASSPTFPADEPPKEMPRSVTPPSPQQSTITIPQPGATPLQGATALPPRRLAVTSITMPDVVAHHLPQHQRRVHHLQRRGRTTLQARSPKRTNRVRPKTASGTKELHDTPTKTLLDESDSDSEDTSLAARLRAMRLAAAGGDADPGLPPPPWATSSTGCSHTECDCADSPTGSGPVTPMPTVGLRGLKLEPIKKSASVEVEAYDPAPAPPPKLRRFLLREKLAKQRPRTAAANARVAMFPMPSIAVDPVTMMGWIPPRMFTRGTIGRVRARRPLLRTSNSTEVSY